MANQSNKNANRGYDPSGGMSRPPWNPQGHHNTEYVEPENPWQRLPPQQEPKLHPDQGLMLLRNPTVLA